MAATSRIAMAALKERKKLQNPLLRKKGKNGRGRASQDASFYTELNIKGFRHCTISRKGFKK